MQERSRVSNSNEVKILQTKNGVIPDDWLLDSDLNFSCKLFHWLVLTNENVFNADRKLDRVVYSRSK